MKEENFILLRDANRVKAELHAGFISYDDALNSVELKDYENMFNREAKIIAKKWHKTFYPFNKSKFLR